MSSTPIRPMVAASHLRQPTLAPRNRAAPAVMASGVNCRMPKMSPSGMCISAIMNSTVEPISMTLRNATLGDIASGSAQLKLLA
jgi:hypothetical protein